jgi:hypothetical protein
MAKRRRGLPQPRKRHRVRAGRSAPQEPIEHVSAGLNVLSPSWGLMGLFWLLDPPEIRDVVRNLDRQMARDGWDGGTLQANMRLVGYLYGPALIPVTFVLWVVSGLVGPASKSDAFVHVALIAISFPILGFVYYGVRSWLTDPDAQIVRWRPWLTDLCILFFAIAAGLLIPVA